MDWVRLGSICSIKFHWFGNRTHQSSVFDFVRLPKSIELNPRIEFDWIRLSSISESSIDYAGNMRTIKRKILKLQSGYDITRSWSFWHWLVKCKSTFIARLEKQTFRTKNFGLLRFESRQKSNGLLNGSHFPRAWFTNTARHANAAREREHSASDLYMSGTSICSFPEF